MRASTTNRALASGRSTTRLSAGSTRVKRVCSKRTGSTSPGSIRTAPGNPTASTDGGTGWPRKRYARSEEDTSELQSRGHLVCRLLHGKKKLKKTEFTLKNNDVRDFCVTTGDVTGYACAADRILISDVQFTEEVEIQGNRSDYESKHVN